MKSDLVVVGAGPAGLSAAVQACRAGLEVTVIDEQSLPGGQIYRQVERIADQEEARADALGPDYKVGASLVRDFRASGAHYVPGALVWQIEPGRVWYAKGDSVESVAAGRILLASGALERPVPIPGWTLPGVMSAGGTQILLKTSGLLPDENTVLMGNGPLLYLLAQQLAAAGGRIQALVETVSPRRYLAAAVHLPAAIGSGYLRKGARMLMDLRRAGLKTYRGASDLSVDGTTKATGVSFRQGSKRVSLPTASVVLHEGVIPNQQITRMANCAHSWSDTQQCFVPDHDDWGNTSVEGIMVAGDGAGIGGALAAEAAGQITALEAARALGRIDEAARDEMAREPRRRLEAFIRGRRFLEVLYAPSISVPRDDATIVCRCEEITAGEVREAVAIGGRGPNQVKSYLRCGMGPCQGRMCGPTVSAIIASERGVPLDEVGYFRIRPPIKPIPLQAIANARIEDNDVVKS